VTKGKHQQSTFRAKGRCDRVAPEHLTGVVVHPEDADSVVEEFPGDFRRLGIPLYDYDGKILWEPG
jgi:hypothetical protein